MPDTVQWKTGKPVGDELGLALPPRRQGSVVDAVLGVLMFTVSDQIYVVRHNPARFVAVPRDTISLPG